MYVLGISADQSLVFFIVIFTIGIFFKKFGSFFIRVWLSVASLKGQMIFLSLQSIIYFLILSPVIVIKKLIVKKSKLVLETNWEKEVYSNRDYTKMG